MPITGEHIRFYYSGGAKNKDPNKSIGGGRSTTEWAGSDLHDLFSKLSAEQNAAEVQQYRCIYVANEHPELSWLQVVAYFTEQSHRGASIEVGLDPAGSGAAQKLSHEQAAPQDVAFTPAPGAAEALQLGTVPPGTHLALWLRRTAHDTHEGLEADGAMLALTGRYAE